MLFMDAICAVLAKLRKDESPCICEEEIEDVYCYKMQVLTLVKRWHWAWSIGEEVPPNQSRSPAHLSSAREKERAITENGERRRSATIAAILQEIKNPPFLKNIANPGVVRVTEKAKSKQERTAASNEERCSAAAREEFLKTMESPLVLTITKRPNQNVHQHIAIKEQHRQNHRATKCLKQQNVIRMTASFSN